MSKSRAPRPPWKGAPDGKPKPKVPTRHGKAGAQPAVQPAPVGEPEAEYVQRVFDPESVHYERPEAPAPTPAPPPAPLQGADIGLLTIILGVGLLANLGPLATDALGVHLRVGQEIASAGFPRVDTFSFTTPGVPAAYPEWLAQLLLHAVNAVAGVPGLAIAQGALLGVTLALVAWSTRGPAPVRALALVPVLAFGLDRGALGPELFGGVWLAVLGIALRSTHPGRHIAVLGLLALWSNTDAGVVWGVGLAVLACVEEFARTRARTALAWAAAFVLVPFLNPYGSHAYDALYTAAAQPYATWQFALTMVMAAAAGVGILNARPFNPIDAARVAALAILALYSTRAGIVMAIFLAPDFGRWYGVDLARMGHAGQRTVTTIVTLGVLAAFAQRVREGEAARLELDAHALPVAAVDFVQRHELDGNVFNDTDFGGYLVWKGFPVFVDERPGVYPAPIVNDQGRIERADPAWQDLVKRYGVEMFVVGVDAPITRALLRTSAWDLLYFDANAAVFVPAGAAPGVRRLESISPVEPSDGAAAIAEAEYLLEENPNFAGGYRMLASLRQRAGDNAGASTTLRRYLELRPEGVQLKETQELIERLQRAGAWEK